MVPVYSSQIGVQYRRSPLGELAVEYDHCAVLHELYDSLGVAEEILFNSVLCAQIDRSSNVSSLILVIKSAIYHNKVMLIRRI